MESRHCLHRSLYPMTMAFSGCVGVPTVAILLLGLAAVASAQLSATFYDASCPSALATIKSAVTAAVNNEPRMGASLLRLHFHDCFVQGCDASVLLNDTATFTGEQTAFPNRDSIRGLNVIDAVKAQVEAVCAQTVSCADILAVAARDSVVALGGPSYTVPLGRRDSTTASLSEANSDLPPPTSDLADLVGNFSRKGLSVTDMVALSEQLAQDVEKCLKIRGGPEMGNSCGTEGTPCTMTTQKKEGLNIDSTRISKHNEGLANPKGIKVKEKTTKGSRRPVGGFEKATAKKKKNKEETVQLQPQGTSTEHLDFFTSQMTAYQLQQNNILNASIPSSIGQTIPMSAYRQELTGFQPNGLIGQTIPMLPYTQELAGFQPYGPLVSHPTNQVHTYLQHQQYALNPSLQGTIGTSTSSLLTRQNQAFFDPKPTE